MFHIFQNNPTFTCGGCRARLKAMDLGYDLLLEALMTALSNDYDATTSYKNEAKIE